MSFSLHWRPVTTPPPDYYLDSQLKYRLARRLWDHDGTLRGQPVPISKGDLRMIGYLEALADQEVPGAKELLAAVQAHETVEIFIGDSGDY